MVNICLTEKNSVFARSQALNLEPERENWFLGLILMLSH